jgi:hypothetical protein
VQHLPRDSIGELYYLEAMRTAIMSDSTIKLSKLDAAHRQLRTAIALWFDGGNSVSVHTLAFAAYEIFHSVSEHRDPYRRDLIFDTFVIKDEYRREWNAHVRRHANFIKHADRDAEATIDFDPELSEMFILYATVGRQLCGEEQSEEESAFLWWFQINRPQMLTEQGRNFVADRIPVDYLQHIRALTKNQFLKGFRLAKLAGKRPFIELAEPHHDRGQNPPR